jgi:Bromodomain extra-terminal - transcription regulation
VTVEMKMEFVDKVKKLSNEGLTQMVTHIQTLLPQSISDLEHEKIQIKVDDFDKDTFGKLSEFIEELIINEQPSKRLRTQ